MNARRSPGQSVVRWSLGIAAVAVAIVMLAPTSAGAATVPVAQVAPVTGPGVAVQPAMRPGACSAYGWYSGDGLVNLSNWVSGAFGAWAFYRCHPNNLWGSAPKAWLFYDASPTGKMELVTVCATDEGRAGNFYILWLGEFTPSFSFLGLARLKTTPQVDSDSSLVASGYNAHWTGTGSAHSHGCGEFVLPYGYSGIVFVQDALMVRMTQLLKGPCSTSGWEVLVAGCSTTGIYVNGGWWEDSFELSWHESWNNPPPSDPGAASFTGQSLP